VPNGNPSFNLKEQEEWFAPLAEAIRAFARDHNLLLDKYYHESASWDLRFNHPRGGQASITVSNDSADFAGVGSVWHVDDFESFTRSIHWRAQRIIVKEPVLLTRELSNEFAAIMALPLGQWTQVAKGYEQIWGQYTKQEFERMAPRYPDPVL